MQQQVDNVRGAFGADARVTLVVGYKLEHVIDSQPDAEYVYNERFDQCNTSKSLLRALQSSKRGGVLWLNGDVVFDQAILTFLQPQIEAEQSFVSVNTSSVSDEEVKYRVDADGFISELSKSVVGGLGEAIGINYVSAHDKAALIKHLKSVDDNDYFERGIELAIEAGDIRVIPIDVSAFFAVEIDFVEDLEEANEHIRKPGS